MSNAKVHTISKTPAASPAKVTKSVTMKLKKETKGTYVYESDADDAVCRQVYLAKDALGNKAHETVTLSVEYTA